MFCHGASSQGTVFEAYSFSVSLKFCDKGILLTDTYSWTFCFVSVLGVGEKFQSWLSFASSDVASSPMCQWMKACKL
jgi:hypothetical protein